ncbi:hypothetical protein MRX96_012077 [Rhipicephalus microplus]
MHLDMTLHISRLNVLESKNAISSGDPDSAYVNRKAANATTASFGYSAELLIDAIKMYPYLYDKRHPSFKDRTKKDRAWAEIGSMFGMSNHRLGQAMQRNRNVPLIRLRRLRRRRRKQAQQQTPTPAPSPVPAKTTEPQRPPLGPRNPTPTDQPTWADKVACKGEAHAAQRQGHSPQQPDPELAQLKRMYAEQAKEIQSLQEELAKQQAPESREGSIISGPVSIRGAKKRAGPTLLAEEQSEFDRFTANIYAILEQYRAETTAEYSAFNAKLESMQKQLIELAAWPAQMDARTKVLEEDLARSKRARIIPRP